MKGFLVPFFMCIRERRGLNNSQNIIVSYRDQAIQSCYKIYRQINSTKEKAANRKQLHQNRTSCIRQCSSCTRQTAARRAGPESLQTRPFLLHQNRINVINEDLFFFIFFVAYEQKYVPNQWKYECWLFVVVVQNILFGQFSRLGN